MIVLVEPARIAGIWPLVYPLLEKAIRREGTHAPGDVLRALQTNAARLWAEVDADQVLSCAVAEIVVFPLKRRMRVWLAGAMPKRRTDWNAYRAAIEEWGRFEGCAEIEAIGRNGWARRLRAQQRHFIVRSVLR